VGKQPAQHDSRVCVTIIFKQLKGGMMSSVTLSLSDILAELRVAEEGLHKFEHRYWISSEQFYQLYSQGLLDDGEHIEDFAEWAGHYKLKERRQAALEAISRKRLAALHRQAGERSLRLTPAEPVYQGE
jgi:hypothetical protein